MDDIYADLENYDDFNTIEELKTENNQLKCKLEEYAIAMDKLKKDYDKLSSEYTHLERNFSSLLKTARAEIERKTHLITKLNKDIDTMVLTSLQNKNKSLLKSTRNMSRHNSTNHDNTVHTKNRKGDNKNLKNKKSIEVTNIGQKKQNSESERKEENNKNSEDIMLNRNSDSNVENRFAEENVQKFTESHRYNKRDTKENKEQGNKLYKGDTSTVDKVRADSIHSRRKSTSDMRYPKFNPDECVSVVNTRNSPLRSTTHVNEFAERKNDDRQSTKISETSSNDDKYSNYYYHEAREENYYKNKTRHYEIDKHRHRDKYESYSRYRRPDSSERLHPRVNLSHYDEQQFRIEHDKHRTESSLFDRRHYKRRSNEHRSKYERDYTYDYERHCHDSHPTKHKIQSDYEGPQNKRIRTNSYNKYADEDKISYREPEFVDEIVMPISKNNIQYTTCQSPDYIPIDLEFSSPIREIMDTAVTCLEDPRVKSKKYIMKTENDNTFLSTITARNVDIKVIDKSLWQIEKVKVPEALLLHPSKYSEQTNKDICMSVDNPVTNMSVESGEIIDFDTRESHCTRFVSENYTTYHETDRRVNNLKKQDTENILDSTTIETSKNDYRYQTNENNTGCQLNPVCLTDLVEGNQDYVNGNNQTNNKEPKDIEKKTQDSTTNECGFTTTLSNYRIPKLKKLDEYSSHQLNTTDVGLCETEDQSDENAKNHTNIKAHEVSEIENEKNLSSNGSCIDYVGKSLEDLQEKPENGNKIVENINKNRLSCTNTLAFNNEDLKPVASLSHHAVEDTDIDNVEYDCKDKKSFALRGFVEEDLEISNETIDHENLQNPRKKSVEEILECDNKHRTKKANTKQKEISPEDPSETTRLKVAINIKSKTKFSALFGDTSSLITPDDLGVPRSQTQTPTSAIYGPVYEDAQNAVDFDMKEMIEVKMRSSTSTADNILIQEKLTTLESVSKKIETDEEPPLKTIHDAKVNTEQGTTYKNIDGDQNPGDFDMEKISKGKMRSSKLRVENRSIEEKQKISHNISKNYETEEKTPNSTKNIPKVSVERKRKSKKSERVQNALDYDIKKTNKSQMRSKPTTENIIIEDKQTEFHNISENDEIVQKTPMTNVTKEQDFIPINDVIGTSIIALATSTPHKTLETPQNEIDSQALDFNSVSNEGKIQKDIPAVTKVTNSDVSDSRADADEPDIRIFVKRRRRVIKQKST